MKDSIAYADLKQQRNKRARENYAKRKIDQVTYAETMRKRYKRAKELKAERKKLVDPIARAELKRKTKKANERQRELRAQRKAADPVAYAENKRMRNERKKELNVKGKEMDVDHIAYAEDRRKIKERRKELWAERIAADPMACADRKLKEIERARELRALKNYPIAHAEFKRERHKRAKER